MGSRNDIIAEIRRNKDEYTSFLQGFVRAASPNPPGQTINAANAVIDYLSKKGITPQLIEPKTGAPNIVSEFTGEGGRGRRIILNGHMDTYPVETPESWEHGPYSGYSDGVSIHGRGGVDMKAGTAASIIAFTILKHRAEHLTGSVALTVVSDEKSGGKWGTRYLLEQCGTPSPWMGDCVLNGEPGGLESIRFGEKGTLRITFNIVTAGANGAYTHFSRGAVIIAAQLIVKLLGIEKLLPDLPDELREHFASESARRAAEEIMGTGASDTLQKPTVNIGTIRGGAKVNTIPEQCMFEADIRLPIGLTAQEVLGHIDTYLKEFPEVSYRVQEEASNPANYCTAKHPFVESIARNAEEATGIKPVMLTGLGGTDCKFYRYRHVPTYVYGPSPKGMGASGEKVLIEEFMALIRTYTLAVWDYLAVA